MKRICFVCTGNTCRSPMAEKLLSMHLKNLGIENVMVFSRGIATTKGEKVSKNSVLALKDFGIRMGNRLAKQLQLKELKPDTMFIVMSLAHKSSLNGFSNIFTFSDIIEGEDIPDPFGKNLDEYKKVAKILNEFTLKLAQKIYNLK